MPTARAETGEPGSRSRRGGRRARRGLIVFGVTAAVVVWLGVSAWMLVQARQEAQDGLDRLEAAQADLGVTELVRGEGVDELRAAEAKFDAAHAKTSSLLLAPLKVVPFVGRQVTSIDALARSASQVVGVGADAMDQSTAELEQAPTTGPERVAMIERLGTIAASARADLDDVDLGPSRALVGPLDDARRRFDRELGRIRDAMADVDDASSGLAQLTQGPSRYLVLAANNAEMRSGSGMLLSAGILEFRDGQFALGPMRPTAELILPPGAVTPTGDLADRWGWVGPNEEWRFLSMSPRFDANAELAAQMWKAKTGEDIDGVLALDPVALQQLLAVTGPVTVDGKEINQENVVNEILLGQYLEYANDPEITQLPDTPEQRARRERLSNIARAVVDQLDRTGWDAATLVDQLRVAGDGRHILAWSANPAQQRAWEAANIAGTLSRTSLLLAVLNTGGNKLDQFTPVAATLEHVEASGGATDVTVRITVRNTTPDGLPAYIAGPFPYADFVAGEYRGTVSVNIPGVAGDVGLVGGEKVLVSGRDGPTWVIATRIRMLPGEARDLVLTFRMPAGYDSIRIEPSARIPPVTWTVDGQTFTDAAAKTIRW